MPIILYLILAVLRERDADSATLLAELRRRAPSEAPSIPALYRYVRRGLDEGWLAVVDADHSDGPGRPSRLYALTPAGRDALRVRANELAAFSSFALDDADDGALGAMHEGGLR
jgi:DNA-binding PadR family transcriptional regulator